MLQIMRQLLDRITNFLQPYWNIFRPHWGKFINLALILATYLLWERTKNTTQGIGDLKLQVKNLNDTCCVNTNLQLNKSYTMTMENVTESTVTNLTTAVVTNLTSNFYTKFTEYSTVMVAIIPNFVSYLSSLGRSNLSLYPTPLAILNNTNTTSEEQTIETQLHTPNKLTNLTVEEANNNTNTSTGTALCTPGSCSTPVDDPEARKLSSDILNYYNTKSVKSKAMVTEDHVPVSNNTKCELVCRNLYQAP